LVEAAVGKKVRFNTEGYNLDALVAHLEALRTVDEASGEVALKGNLFFHDVVTVLHRAIMFEGDIPERDLMGIVRGALFRSAKAGSLRTGPLLGELSRGCEGFSRGRTRRSSLSRASPASPSGEPPGASLCGLLYAMVVTNGEMVCG
jgi:hypothetical protein